MIYFGFHGLHASIKILSKKVHSWANTIANNSENSVHYFGMVMEVFAGHIILTSSGNI